MSVIGSPDDILDRVKRLVPRGWFAWAAPYRDAIMGGLSDRASWCYGLIAYARAQTRLATAYGIWLDIFSFDFLGSSLPRNGAADDAFRALIRATILQERVTRAGMLSVISRLTGNTPKIFEPWNTGDTGAYSNAAAGQICGQFGYGVGNGGYGSMQLPAQTFMQVFRGSPSGVPDVGGYTDDAGGYGKGPLEYVSSSTSLIGITDAIIENAINLTRPTGSTVWLAFVAPHRLLTTDSGMLLTNETGAFDLTTG